MAGDRRLGIALTNRRIRNLIKPRAAFILAAEVAIAASEGAPDASLALVLAANVNTAARI